MDKKIDTINQSYTDEVKHNILNSCFTDNPDGTFRFSKEALDAAKEFQEIAFDHDISLRGNTQFIRSELKNQQFLMENRLNILNRAYLSQNKDIAARAIYDLMVRESMIKDYLNNKEYTYDLDSEKPINWNDLAKNEIDPEIAEIGQDMSSLEDALSQSNDYATQTFIEASNELTSLQESMDIADDLQRQKSLEDVAKNINTNDKSVGEVVFLDELKSGNIDILNGMTNEQKDDLIKEMWEQLQHTDMINRVSAHDYIDKANVAMKACIDKSKSLFPEISSNVARFAQETASKAGQNLLSGYEKASRLFEQTVRKAHTAVKKLNFSYDCILERISGGTYSKMLEKLESKAYKANTYEAYKDGEITFGMTKDGQFYIPNPPTRSEKLAKFIMDHQVSSKDIIVATWKDGKRPTDPRNIIEIGDKILDNSQRISLFEIMKDLKTEVREGYKDFLDNAALKYADHIEKTAQRSLRRVEKYLETDKIVFQAKEDINRSLNSIAGIQPLPRGKYVLSEDMEKKLELLKDLQEKKKNLNFFNKDYRQLNKMIKDGLKEFEELSYTLNKLNAAQVKAEQLSDKSQAIIDQVKAGKEHIPEEIQNAMNNYQNISKEKQSDSPDIDTEQDLDMPDME